jgi:predicted DNA-binding transcriptional regulator AlpA
MVEVNEVRFVSPRRASDLTSLSTRQISRLVEAGQFPVPLRLGAGRNGRIAYLESEVRQWLLARLGERAGKAA